ncbi:MAG TPA: MFS transporter [Deferrisomatales bacterium]|nr:MFS transporter [Deferrisomatales bacterium]
MAIYPLLFLAVCCQTCNKGSRLLIALFAIELGASTFWIGVLIALYGFFPAFLAISAGRLSDRFGPRLPMVLGALGVGLGLWLPCALGSLPALFVSAALIGAAFVFFQVSLQNLMGSLGERTDRASNYSQLSLAAAVSSFLAPVLTGFWIDRFGYTTTYGILGALAVVTCIGLLVLPFIPGRGNRKQRPGQGQGLGGLLQDADLRRTLVVSGVVVTGVHLYSFYFPIYGHEIGFSASRIGVVMGSYAVAAFIVRMVMPAIVRVYSEGRVLTHSLWVSGLAFFLFPFFRDLFTLTTLSFLLGLGLGCGQPLSILMTFNSSPDGRSGEVLGVRLTANKGIQVAVPVLFGSMGAAFGLFPVFWANGALLLLGGGISVRRRNRDPGK